VALAVVLGVLLKVETMGFDGDPPSLPRPPMNVARDRDGQRTFVYNLSPAEENLSVEDVCARIGSRIEKALRASPFMDAPFAARLTLEFGVLADREDASFSYSWPPEFLRTLVEFDIILNVSHYLPSPGEKAATTGANT
jgi:hypothetical protein